MKKRIYKRISAAGFTLIELLVVMAITAILLGLIFGPMIQGFNLTNRARVQVLAQDSARAAMEIAQRDMANAVYVFHQIPAFNQLLPINGSQREAAEPNSVSLWVRDGSRNLRRILLAYGMMDFVPPARTMDQNIPISSAALDPTTGLALQRGDVALPLAPGRTITRYWLGLRNNTPGRGTVLVAAPEDQTTGWPAVPYGNFYENTREISLQEHNPVALFRAVVSPYVPSPGPPQVDRRLFRIASGQPVMYDPNFWYDGGNAQNVVLPDGTTTNRVSGWKDLNGDGLVQICENWRAIAEAVVPVDRADLVISERDDQNRTLYFDTPRGLAQGFRVPRVAPQCRFQPTYVGNDAGAPSAMEDLNNEAPTVAPSAFRESAGHWTLPYRAYVYRSALTAAILRYFVFDGRILDEGATLLFNIREQQFDTVNRQLTSDLPVAYRVRKDHYLAGRLWLADGERPNIIYNVDDRRGVINFAVPHSAVLGWEQVGTQWREVPAAFFADEANQRWSAADALGEQGYRYINLADMAYTPPAGTTAPTSFSRRSPFTVVGTDTYIPNAQLVPGSETVIGPDMRPGPHYGLPITYTRIPRSNDPLSIGPNEYMINYSDIQPPATGTTALHPVNQAGTIIFDSNRDPQGRVEHVLPVFQADGITRISNQANIMVTYKIQNNLRSDVVKADYLTREMMTVALGVRLFEFNSGQPQQVTLTQKIKIRNLQR